MGSFRCTCPPHWTGERCEIGQGLSFHMLLFSFFNSLMPSVTIVVVMVFLFIITAASCVFTCVSCDRCEWVFGQFPSLSPRGHLYQHPRGLHLSVSHWLDWKELWKGLVRSHAFFIVFLLQNTFTSKFYSGSFDFLSRKRLHGIRILSKKYSWSNIIKYVYKIHYFFWKQGMQSWLV